jgi:hypothetical protein
MRDVREITEENGGGAVAIFVDGTRGKAWILLRLPKYF